MALELPACGIYRTGRPLPGREEEIPAGRLVFFHNHSQQGEPMVLLPETNEDNRWTFHDRGFLVRGPDAEAFVESLESLPREGFYVVTQEVPLGPAAGQALRPRTLVQVGYNRAGEAILFPARAEGNGFSFPAQGHRFVGLEVFEGLEPAGFDPPQAPSQDASERLLH